MKLYLSSDRIPTPNDLIDLIGKPARETRVALIPNSKDYYAMLPGALKLRSLQKL